MSKAKVTDYQFDMRLDTGTNLEVLVFNEYGANTVRWIFTHRYASPRKPGDMPKLVIDYSLTANYVAGRLAEEFELSMEVVIPERMGKKSFAGVDISPGARTYLRFLYRKIGHTVFRLAAVAKGAAGYTEIPEGPALVQQTELPFVLLDRVERDGEYAVPFHSRAEEVEHFYFPESIERYPARAKEDD